jgi:hypothetical protein
VVGAAAVVVGLVAEEVAGAENVTVRVRVPPAVYWPIAQPTKPTGASNAKKAVLMDPWVDT